VWDRFEARYETEHYLGPEVRARELIERFTAVGAPANAIAFRAAIEALPWPDLRSVYGRLLAFVGGPDELAELVQRGWNATSPVGQRVAELLLEAHLLVARRTPGPDELTPVDIEPVAECQQIDARVADALRRVYADQASPADFIAMTAAVQAYRGVLARAPLSPGGREAAHQQRGAAARLHGPGCACAARRRGRRAELHGGQPRVCSHGR
jgi:hypothetical protein